LNLKELSHSIITIELINTYLKKTGNFSINIKNHLQHNSYIQTALLKSQISKINKTNTIQNNIAKIIIEHNLQSTYLNNDEKIIYLYIK